ncbi:helix-turn-helix domain-containing protein [Nocardioides sp. QY071]|uniref:helix-turn-helix domain-containing protein n=1 Tax=Nocardioides sp. QY071 TaxID=3044187 RepID=UPI00249A16D6|nr:helix-turn-helix domain-containing protein [Nocardioides sp. QY071]WGY04015.1 helix-turn-helix domain-containing protein [Nocardioides sp. QY071]
MSSKTGTAKRSQIQPLDRLMYTREETAQRLGVSVRLLKRWQLDGKIHATKPGGDKGQVFFTADEIARFLRDSTR